MLDHMKRLQIMIDEDLDAILDRMAIEQHTSKAALIRRLVRQAVATDTEETDPVMAMAGVDDYDPGTDTIDDVVYGL